MKQLMTNKIKNCEFAFKCPMQWDELTETDIENKKFCDRCNKPVIFCETPEQLETAAKNRDCVAVQIGLIYTLGDLPAPTPVKADKE
jgi:hypothetical protein